MQDCIDFQANCRRLQSSLYESNEENIEQQLKLNEVKWENSRLEKLVWELEAKGACTRASQKQSA